MTKDPTFWIVSRAAGITAYALITCSMLAGLVLKSRPFGKRVKPATVTDLHRFLTTLALAAIAVHGLALLGDTTVTIDPLGLVVPGRISYRPVWTGLGVVTAEVAVVVYASFSLRKHIGARNWRRLHWLTYVVFATATAHGIFAGTDSGTPWMRNLYLGSLGAVVFATAWRALAPPGGAAKRKREPRTSAPTASEPTAP
jgi:sulfoxide reductase heme-binding subunit YedZ